MTTPSKNFDSDFPTKEQVNSFLKACEEADKNAAQAWEYRMQNYFNCVDDYSWGGLCDQAQDEARRLRDHAKAVLSEQIQEGKPFIREFTVNVLTDLNGNVVSETLVNGRFGKCWIIKGDGDSVSFVGTAKRQATYNKKGYKIMERAYVVEFYYTMKMTKNGLLTRGRVISQCLRDVVEFPKYLDTRLASVAYFALQNS